MFIYAFQFKVKIYETACLQTPIKIEIKRPWSGEHEDDNVDVDDDDNDNDDDDFDEMMSYLNLK